MSAIKKNWLFPAIAAVLTIIAAAAYLLFKIGQESANHEKWKDYDDYGWA
ncbi:MAG: hypothetical protein LBI36_01755 [Oscillospiraceae bacterium]|jgi:hypothetical protein|nr:hypothetical protein [Oscillospiraceae bacterium]